jgi:hypothetical protein
MKTEGIIQTQRDNNLSAMNGWQFKRAHIIGSDPYIKSTLKKDLQAFTMVENPKGTYLRFAIIELPADSNGSLAQLCLQIKS